MSDKLRKLSDAIRLGATFGHQVFLAGTDGLGGTCALGAAYEAAFGKPINPATPWMSEELMNRFPVLKDLVSGHFLAAHIMELNDNQKQTREQIADWLESKGY